MSHIITTIVKKEYRMQIEKVEKTVYIPVEIKCREFLGKLILASYFLKDGWQVVIGEHGYVRDYALQHRGGVYFEKDFYHLRNATIKKLHRKGFIVYAWDEEGLSIGDSQQYCLRQVDQETLSNCDRIITWGNYQKDIIIKEFPLYKEKLFSLGNPRIDLLRRRNRVLYQRELEIIREKYGNYVLFNSNFASVTTPEILVDSKRILFSHQNNANDIWRSFLPAIEEQKRTLKILLTTIKKLAEVIPENIIIRPHPTENSHFWVREFEEYPNVKVIKKYDVNSWILGADVVIHNSCTTGIESYIARKPVIIFQPIKNSIYKDRLANQLGQQVSNQRELIKYVNYAILYRKNFEKIREVFFHPDTESLLHKVITLETRDCSEVIEEFVKQEMETTDEKMYTITYKERIQAYYAEFIFCLFYRKSAKIKKWQYESIWSIKRRIESLLYLRGVKRKLLVYRVAHNVYQLRVID